MKKQIEVENLQIGKLYQVRHGARFEKAEFIGMVKNTKNVRAIFVAFREDGEPFMPIILWPWEFPVWQWGDENG